MLDLVILGAGPAGITAAIYAKRAGLNFLIVEKNVPGGQIVNSSMVENYPGFKSATGADLAMLMVSQLEELDVEITFCECLEIIKEKEMFRIVCDKELVAHTVLIATGLTHRKLGVINEDLYVGKGISWCATCDGALYKNKDVAVIGGGNSAFEEALYLSSICSKVTIIQRTNIKAEKRLVDLVATKNNIEILTDASIVSFEGGPNLESITVKKQNEFKINVKAAFIYIGYEANNSFLKNFDIFDDRGNIIVNEHMETVVEGMYAAGDVVQKEVRQIVTAVSDGAKAALSVCDYLKRRI